MGEEFKRVGILVTHPALQLITKVPTNAPVFTCLFLHIILTNIIPDLHNYIFCNKVQLTVSAFVLSCCWFLSTWARASSIRFMPRLIWLFTREISLFKMSQ